MRRTALGALAAVLVALALVQAALPTWLARALADRLSGQLHAQRLEVHVGAAPIWQLLSGHLPRLTIAGENVALAELPVARLDVDARDLRLERASAGDVRVAGGTAEWRLRIAGDALAGWLERRWPLLQRIQLTLADGRAQLSAALAGLDIPLHMTLAVEAAPGNTLVLRPIAVGGQPLPAALRQWLGAAAAFTVPLALPPLAGQLTQVRIEPGYLIVEGEGTLR